MKNQIKNLTSLCFYLIILTTFVFAQSVLTNDGVIEMVKGGLSAEIIKAKIKSSSTKFDTSTEALKKLTDAKVPESVIVAMIEQEQSQKQTAAQTKKETTEAAEKIPEQGELSDILGMKKIYVFSEDIKERDIIKTELRKDNSFNFVVVDKIEDCDFAIKYESWEEVLNVTSVYNKQTVGVLTILMSSLDANSDRVRYIYSTKKTKYYIWERNPAESATKQFIKDLTKIASNK